MLFEFASCGPSSPYIDDTRSSITAVTLCYKRICAFYDITERKFCPFFEAKKSCFCYHQICKKRSRFKMSTSTFCAISVVFFQNLTYSQTLSMKCQLFEPIITFNSQFWECCKLSPNLILLNKKVDLEHQNVPFNKLVVFLF